MSDDLRVGDLLGRAVAAGEPARVVILGFPTDVGVRRNGGRAGAALAPAEIRRWLRRFTPDARARVAFLALLESTEDRGDLTTGDDLEADQARLGEAVGGVLATGAFPIVLGGGHETGYGHFLGYVAAGRAVSILNWDAHPDVRPLRDGLGHSGSPFRQALLHPSGLCRGYRVAGLLPHSTAASHLDFVNAHGGHLWRDQLDPTRVRGLYAAARSPTMVTFDIDAVDQSQAPGVSAPATNGISTPLWLLAAHAAGRSTRVTSCDLVEVSPPHDRDGQTARLAALTVYELLRGLAARAGTDSRRRR